jgi:hypothetical protein
MISPVKWHLKWHPHFTALKFAENMAAMLLIGVIVAFFAQRTCGNC